VAKVIIPPAFFFATLFHLSDINFQLEHFKMMGFLKMMLFVILLTAILNIYRLKKALKNRKHDYRLA
jgi:hypothetical protein